MKKIITSILFILGCAALVNAQCGGAVHVDLASAVCSNSASTFSITVANPNELILIAYNGWFGPAAGPVTVDGNPATAINTAHTSNDACASVYCYKAPAAGLHTIVCSENGYSSPYYLNFAVGFYSTGACTSLKCSSITTTQNALPSGTTVNCNITTVTANSIIFGSFVYNTGIFTPYAMTAVGTTILNTEHNGDGIDASDGWTNAPAAGPYTVSTADVNSCCGGATVLAAVQPCNCVLPVQLTGFNCAPVQGGIELKWSTATETNSSHFTVERSTDGIQFTPITRLDAAGNTETPRYYSYLDNTALNGAYYYRLVETDLDGESQTFSVSECSNSNTDYGEIYPNPCNGNFTILLGPSIYSQTLTVTDLIGRQVYSQKFDPSAEEAGYNVTLPNNVTGVFIAKLMNGSQLVSVKRVMVY